MRCPFCSEIESRVLDSRTADEGMVIRRRRECIKCRRRFTTYERYEDPPLYVIKKDGRREVFDRTKLVDGITRACQKRPVSREAIEQVGYEIERALRDTLTDEVSSSRIGDLVMRRLRDLDEVAYVRFASVYKEFHDLSSFVNEIERLFQLTQQERLNTQQPRLFEGEPTLISK
jgi:transcriptional repressor NrdR